MGGVFVWYDTTMETRSKLEQHILKGLANVIDPELGIDIVSLGLIYKVLAPDGVTPP